MSFILTATGVVCSLALTTCLAYGLSKKGLPGRNVLTFLVFFTMLFNGGLVPTYINYTTVFHVKDTFFGAAGCEYPLISVGTPLFRQERVAIL